MITELKTFVAVAHYGTFAAAAERIGLTQSAVSAQMKRLEEKLGSALFVRTGRSAELNDVGHTVLAKAGELIALAETLADPIDADALTGRLRIGAIASVHTTLLLKALPAFKAQFPGMHLRVIPGTSLELLNQLDAGDLDLAIIIRPGFGIPQNLSWDSLLQERFVLAAPISQSIDDVQEALSTLPFIRYHRSSFGGRRVARYLEETGIAVRDWAELDDIPTLLALVEEGHGVAIVPEVQAYQEAFERIQLIPIDEAGFVRETGIIRSSRCTAVASRFVAICREMAVQTG